MRRFRPIWSLALFLLLWATAAPQTFASWSCDGRVCSTGWSCCCVLPTSSQDGNCGATPSGPTDAAGVCGSACACVGTVQSWDQDRSPATPAVQASPVHVALMPPPPQYLGPLPTERVARSHALRGPPPDAGHLATPALRGPPTLTFPSFGS